MPLCTPTDLLAVQKKLATFYGVARDDLRDRATRGLFTPTATPLAWDAWQGLKPRVARYLAIVPSWKTVDRAFADGADLLLEITRFSDRTGGVIVGSSIIYTWQDMAELQTAIAADYKVLNAAVQACNAAQPGGARSETELDDLTLTDWEAMQGRVADFVRQDAQGMATGLDAQVEAGRALQTDLAAWHDRLKAAGCRVATAPTIAQQGYGLGNIAAGLGSLLSSPVGFLLVAFLVLHEVKR